MNRILLAGATGYIGRAVALELLRQDYEVLAVVRDPDARLPGCSVIRADVTNVGELQRSLDGTSFDAVISCIASRTGTRDDAWLVDFQANQNLLLAARANGVERFVLLSAICVQRPHLAFQKAKLAFEKELRESGLDFTIVRPTAFFKSLSGQVERVQAGKPFLLFGSGTATACKPIGEADLARFVADCLSDPLTSNKMLPIGGPGEAITPRQQGEMLFSLLGLKPRFRSVPASALTIISKLLRPFGKIFPAAADKAELARIGHYYATESMLVWDAELGRYDADATPATGGDTLRAHYQRVLEDGLGGQELREHKLL